ncbi:MAG TPA: acyltransferase [Devosia sp.]|nr:acyltransferase [Devosia sp.]
MQRLYGIQYLRFVAALLVMLGHAFMDGHDFHLIDDRTYAALGTIPWGGGVDIFFVISGFIITMLLDRDAKSRGGERFLANRLIRVAPIYWLYTAAMLLAATVVTAKGAKEFNLDYIGASFGFIPWPDERGMPRPILGQGWTLEYEMYFYLLAYIVALIAGRARNLSLAIVLGGVTLALYATSQLTPFGRFYTGFYGSLVVFEFVVGIACYNIYRNAPPVKFWFKCALVAVGAVLMVGLSQIAWMDRLFAQGLPAGLIVMGFALPGRRQGRPIPWLEEFGNASYSLYLLHPFVTNGCALLFAHFLPNGWPPYVSVSIVVATAAAVISYNVIEKPMIAYLRARLPERATPSLTTAGVRDQ